LITDAFFGVETFFEPGEEILVARSGQQVAEILCGLTPERASAVGQAARRRALADHTYASRAVLVEQALGLAPMRKVAS
jgi:spore maturation protein CgeB